jgi:phospholipid/cholesterol/gamma-HCH transport system substrate-binding protein
MPLNLSSAGQDQQHQASNDRQAAIGLIFLLLAALVILSAIWLARVQFAHDYAIYDVELAGQVQGLAKGGAVFINGVRTGEVTDLALDPKNPSKVVARIRVSADTPVRQDSTAALEWLGVSGSRFIQLSGGTLSKPLLKRTASAGKIPVIHGALEAFDSKNGNGRSAAAQALYALDVLNQRLSDQNLAAISESLANARATAGTWRGRSVNLAALDAQLLNATHTSDELARSAQSANDRVNGDGRRTLGQLADSSAKTKGSIESARAQIRQLQATAGTQTQSLPAITSRTAEFGAMVERAGEVIGQLDSQAPQPLGPPLSQELKVAP